MASDPTLRRMRKASGMSIRDLEIATGINRGRLSVIERGIEPTEAELRAILDAITGPGGHVIIPAQDKAE